MEEELRKAFEARDVDGDGVLGLEDLKTATGLSEGELAAVFEVCQGAQGNGQFLTFEEFASGFRQFPRPSLHISIPSTIEEASSMQESAPNTQRELLSDTIEALAVLLNCQGESPTQTLIKLGTMVQAGGQFPCEQLGAVLSAAGKLIEAQDVQLINANRDYEDKKEACAALARQYSSLKQTCRLLTEQSYQVESELSASIRHSEVQGQLLQSALSQAHRSEQLQESELADCQAELAARKALVCRLRRDVLTHAREDRKEDAPSPQAPKTSRAPSKFLFSPANAREVTTAHDSYRQKKRAQLGVWQQALEEQEQRLLSRELGLEEAVSHRCTQLQREVHNLQAQLVRERIKSEHYKVLARDSTPLPEMLINPLSDELDRLREPSPIRVRLIPIVRTEKPKRCCWTGTS